MFATEACDSLIGLNANQIKWTKKTYNTNKIKYNTIKIKYNTNKIK